MDERITSNEREARRLAVQVKHIADCMEGYKGFVEILKTREEQKIRLREKLIQQGLGALMLSIAGAVVATLWFAIVSWLRDPK